MKQNGEAYYIISWHGITVMWNVVIWGIPRYPTPWRDALCYDAAVTRYDSQMALEPWHDYVTRQNVCCDIQYSCLYYLLLVVCFHSRSQFTCAVAMLLCPSGRTIEAYVGPPPWSPSTCWDTVRSCGVRRIRFMFHRLSIIPNSINLTPFCLIYSVDKLCVCACLRACACVRVCGREREGGERMN